MFYLHDAEHHNERDIRNSGQYCNNIAFIMSDGRKFEFSFNRYNLEYDDIVYEISSDDDLLGQLRGIISD